MSGLLIIQISIGSAMTTAYEKNNLLHNHKIKFRRRTKIGEGLIRQELEEKIQSANLQNKFILLGFLDNAAKYLKAFDLFVLPSRSEAMPLVVLEVGLAKIPLISSRVGGIPEVISDNSFGKLFDSENVSQLTNVIKSSIDNYEDAKQIATNLNQRVKENFNHQKMLDGTIAQY